MDANAINEIAAVENKYGTVMFRFGLTHLVDVGIRHLDDETVEESLKQIIAKGKIEKFAGSVSVMTPGFQCEIVRCAAELAKFSIWALFLYIKERVTIGTPKHEAGTCPNCGSSNLESGDGEVAEGDYVYKWSCNECNAYGREFYDMVFSEYIIDGGGE